MSNNPKNKQKKSVAEHAAGYLLGTAGLTVALVLILGSLAFSVSLAGNGLSSAQLAAVVSARLVDLTNGDRSSDQLSTLTLSPVLTAAAQAKADDMARNGYFAHVSPTGLDSWHWFQLESYSFSYAGENLAVDFTDSDAVNQAWLNSPTHRANILNGHFTEIGIATAQGMYEGHETTFVVQMFGAPAKPAPITTSILPANPSELATANTGTTTAEVFGASAKPKPSAPVKIAIATKPQPATTTEVATTALAVTSAPEHYAPFWAGLLASPRSLLRIVYIFFAFCFIVALAIRTRFEFKRHHLKHMYAVVILLVVMGGLFLAADRLVFVTPILGTAQSI